ncbi:ParB N-terminal domain-containing protein [Loigolactobacillus binensis]|uniref:ParB N-terminal domain-containing protein n=1 Tax=Loigolactobacillus binensis TaxID=2559922 RepID=A0ABW3E8D6_9LACO|nr:ParB N-terminal domain-containing protein [Loigolactobacillus binensis]
MNRKIGNIYITSNYGKFKRMEGNRSLTNFRILTKSIQKNGVLKPIIVNKNFEILDGQHRYEAAKMSEKPVPYMFSIQNAENEIIELNSTAKNWTLNDYTHSYIQLEQNDDYKIIAGYIKNHHVATTDLIICSQGYLKRKANYVADFKKGKFHVWNEPAFSEILNVFERFLEITRVQSHIYVFQAYFNLASLKGFNNDWLIESANGQQLAWHLLGLKKFDDILKEFLNAYNFELKKKDKIKYKITKKHEVEIIDQMDPALVNIESI